MAAPPAVVAGDPRLEPLWDAAPATEVPCACGAAFCSAACRDQARVHDVECAAASPWPEYPAALALALRELGELEARGILGLAHGRLLLRLKGDHVAWRGGRGCAPPHANLFGGFAADATLGAPARETLIQGALRHNVFRPLQASPPTAGPDLHL